VVFIQLHAIISGQVQGVGFRYSTEKVASSLGLTGWVKNLDSGNVEVLAQGDKPVLEKMLEWLHKGPRSANVSNVEYDFSDKNESYHYFMIEQD
jgi:acylphosphatase